MIGLGCLRVQGQTELFFPIESKTSSRQCIVSLLGARPFAGNIRYSVRMAIMLIFLITAFGAVLMYYR